MQKQPQSFDVYPRIVRSNSQTVITIRALYDHVQFVSGETYTARLVPAEGAFGLEGWQDFSQQEVVPNEHELRIPCIFAGEQEYVLLLDRGEQLVGDFRLYALEPDLFDRKPYKGDMHMHSHRSDGKESPAYVAASCRLIGLDFMALTDHRQYTPSLEAIEAFRGLEIDLRIYPGEEVHPPAMYGHPVRAHMVNFGGSFSVNELFESKAYAQEVQAIADQLTNLPEGTAAYPVAACEWVFDKIRAGGGLGIFCHPYWFSRHSYDITQRFTNVMFERQRYDALEVIGGYHRYEVESNTLQVARYHEERARGRRIPIVGVSDSHGCNPDDLFGWYYTIVFAASTNLPELIGAIKDLYSVAVEAIAGETARAYGPFRLVRYAQFLMREVFPQHDALCLEEGRLMLAHAAGDSSAAEALAKLRGRTQSLYNHWWESPGS